jgi:hypothetical protein
MQTATNTAVSEVHPTPLRGPDRCILLSGIGWDTYERLLADMGDSHVARFAYDQGVIGHRGRCREIWVIVSTALCRVALDSMPPACGTT